MARSESLSENLKDQRIAYALLRVIVGVNLLMHGVSRLLVGADVFTAKITEQFAQTALPHWSVVCFATFLPWAEAVVGLLLLLGLCTRYALIAGSLLLIVLTFGAALVEDWPVAGLQLSYAIAYAALLFLRSYNRYSIDGWRGGRASLP